MLQWTDVLWIISLEHTHSPAKFRDQNSGMLLILHVHVCEEKHQIHAHKYTVNVQEPWSSDQAIKHDLCCICIGSYMYRYMYLIILLTQSSDWSRAFSPVVDSWSSAPFPFILTWLKPLHLCQSLSFCLESWLYGNCEWLMTKAN